MVVRSATQILQRLAIVVIAAMASCRTAPTLQVTEERQQQIIHDTVTLTTTRHDTLKMRIVEIHNNDTVIKIITANNGGKEESTSKKSQAKADEKTNKVKTDKVEKSACENKRQKSYFLGFVLLIVAAATMIVLGRLIAQTKKK